MKRGFQILNTAVEGGIEVGNHYDKYNTKNPIAKLLQNNFQKNVLELIQRAHPASIHEAGCGEGFWTLKLLEMGYAATGSDFSSLAISKAKENGDGDRKFFVESIYDLSTSHTADMILCLEVLEHLQDPARALKKLSELARPWLLCSVPNEPLWSLLNLCRGRYLNRLGNTPGHIQRFSSGAFINLLGNFFQIVEVRKPMPWTMVLARV